MDIFFSLLQVHFTMCLIKEIYITCNTVDEASLGSIVSTIGFFFLESREEGLCNSVIERIMRSGEGLSDSILFEQVHKCLCGVLCSSITMKDKVFRTSPFAVGFEKSPAD